jgi:hypothetical protein
MQTILTVKLTRCYQKFVEYKSRDILGELCAIIGIDRKIAENNNLHSGGAQYLLKNVDSYYWSKVMNDCILINILVK